MHQSLLTRNELALQTDDIPEKPNSLVKIGVGIVFGITSSWKQLVIHKLIIRRMKAKHEALDEASHARIALANKTVWAIEHYLTHKMHTKHGNKKPIETIRHEMLQLLDEIFHNPKQ